MGTLLSDVVLTLGSFEDWAEWCRDPLLSVGCRDPIERIEMVKADDPILSRCEVGGLPILEGR